MRYYKVLLKSDSRELYLQSIRRGTMATPATRSGLRGILLSGLSRGAVRRKCRRGIPREVEGTYSGAPSVPS